MKKVSVGLTMLAVLLMAGSVYGQLFRGGSLQDPVLVQTDTIDGTSAYRDFGGIGFYDVLNVNPDPDDHTTWYDWADWTTDWGNQLGGFTGPADEIPTGGFNVRNDAIMYVKPGTVIDVGGGRIRLGYYQGQRYNAGGYGVMHIGLDPGENLFDPSDDIVETDPSNTTVTADYIRVGLWNWWTDTSPITVPTNENYTYSEAENQPAAAIWQHGGTVTTEVLDLGRGDNTCGPPSNPLQNGFGIYVISGNSVLTETYNGINLGTTLDHPDGHARGIFWIKGDQATISAAEYQSSEYSTTRIELTADATVTPIEVHPRWWHTGELDNTIKGTLWVDSSAGAPAVGTKVTVLTIDEGSDPTKTCEDILEILDYTELTIDPNSTVGANGEHWALMPETAIQEEPCIVAMRIQYIAAVAGDANNDGVVDVADLGILAGNYGSSGLDISWAQADFNLDETVDVSDLGILAGNYGGGPVPEPATLSLLVLGGLALLRRKRG